MSGGVDSSVAAAMLVDAGYTVHGITLQVWEPEDDTAAVSKRWQERSCCKVGIAKFVAQRLGITYEVIDTRQTFRKGVIDDFLNGYLEGETPNPCVRCNERVKLRSLYQLAEERGVDYVATGHYARILPEKEGLALHRAQDRRKDQSYFLYRLSPSWLPRLLFPLGTMQKTDVWKQAELLGLPPDELKESQEICFVSQGDYRTFIASEVPESSQPGFFMDSAGHVLGRHDGVAFYTPGQRRGLGIATGHRLYVQRVDAQSRSVILGSEEDLYRSTCTVGDLNLFEDGLLQDRHEAEVKIRYATAPSPAILSGNQDGTMTISFHSPQRALSPGQSAVFYRSDRVLGGGIIQP
jgi:tRNA-specific 2-thiouridylase